MDSESDCNSKKVKWVGNAQFGCVVGLIVLFAVGLSLIPLIIFWFLKMDLYGGVVIGFVVLYLIFRTGWHFAKKWSGNALILIKEVPEYQSESPHHAIIIAHKNQPEEGGSYSIFDYMDGIDILIKKFRDSENPVNYKVYEVSSKKEIIRIINNPKTTHLWIFGHGKRNYLALHSDGLCYFDVKTAPKKVFIGQFHGNSWYGKSLADYNKPDYSDITRWARFSPFTQIAIKKDLEILQI
ncbi:MAG: hypothetical protein NTZ39_03615 [Methanoregula sp.]|nr:hypothetical protein [Methanoregula sp.]